MSFVFQAKAKKLAGPIRAVSGIKPSSVGMKLKQKDHVENKLYLRYIFFVSLFGYTFISLLLASPWHTLLTYIPH